MAGAEAKVYAVLDEAGTCIKIAENMDLANAFIIQKRLEEALTSLYGPGAIEKYKQALVLPADALKKAFGSDAASRVEFKANSIAFTIEAISTNDLIRATREITKRPDSSLAAAKEREEHIASGERKS